MALRGQMISSSLVLKTLQLLTSIHAESEDINPISGRLLATPISGRGGGGCLGPPLDISGSYRSIFKIQTAFVSPQHDLHF